MIISFYKQYKRLSEQKQDILIRFAKSTKGVLLRISQVSVFVGLNAAASFVGRTLELETRIILIDDVDRLPDHMKDFLEKTDWGVERGLLWEGNANLSSAQDQIQASYDKLKSENYNLTQRISQSEEEVAHLQAVNSNITAQRDELQERLDGRKRCPQNWNWHEFGNHCYYVSTSTKTWEDSKKHCENQDAYLVIITSEEEQEFISGLRVAAWIGLIRQEDGEHWKWVDGSPLTTGYWANNEPNNAGNNEDCVGTYGRDFLWNDYPCGYLLRWICKKEI